VSGAGARSLEVMPASPACHLQRRVAVLVWVPVLLLFPLLNVYGGPARVAGQVLLIAATAAVAVTVVVTSGTQHPPRRATALTMAVLVALVAVASVQGEGWTTVWGLLAIIAPAVLRGWWLLATIVVATVGTGVSIAVVSGVGDTWWLSVGGVALAGASTTSLLRLLESNEQLQRTREELAEAAVAKERERFSRDLHDLLGHTLSVMVVKAQAVQRLAGRDPEAAAGHAADIEAVGRTALVDVRTAVDQMRSLSLVHELEGARRALDTAGIRTRVTACDVPESADEVLAWVVRESTTNVLRHSGAASCRFEVTSGDGEVRLTVSDDGVGTDAAGSGGRPDRVGGLDGLRRRLLAAGGELDVRPEPGGFRVEARVPAT
jgi:two-component system sensor histidine kinase DesK